MRSMDTKNISEDIHAQESGLIKTREGGYTSTIQEGIADSVEYVRGVSEALTHKQVIATALSGTKSVCGYIYRLFVFDFVHS